MLIYKLIVNDWCYDSYQVKSLYKNSTCGKLFHRIFLAIIDKFIKKKNIMLWQPKKYMLLEFSKDSWRCIQLKWYG